MKSKSVLLAASAALGGLAGAVIAGRVAQAYRRDQQVTLAQLMARSDVIDTARGPVEYAQAGSGPAVLVIHGGGGGYDQGLSVIEVLRDVKARFIAPSRFGYLRSPLPANATPEAQADTFAALLDALGVDRAAVLALSAGGMTAVNFALRHPDRCRGLILASAITRPHRYLQSLGAQMAAETLLASDFAAWALAHWPEIGRQINGVRPEHLALIAGDADARRGLDGLLTVPHASRRHAGLLNDWVQAEVLPEYPLNQITAPTLVIHGTHDPLVPFHFGVRAAMTIPNARLLILEDAGHLAWFTHAAQVRPAVLSFLTTSLSP